MATAAKRKGRSEHVLPARNQPELGNLHAEEEAAALRRERLQQVGWRWVGDALWEGWRVGEAEGVEG